MAVKTRKPKPLDPRIAVAIARLRLASLGGKGADADAPPIWAPHPDNKPQNDAYTSEAQVIGYGGAAGGGKSDLAIGYALTKHKRSIIFRREYPQLRDIIRRTKELTEGHRTGFNNNEGLLSLPGSATVEYGAMKDADDWEKYKGRPHDFIGYDEATELLELQVRSTSAWLRSTDTDQPCRMLLTFNPPTNIQGMWVIRYFAPWLDPMHPNPAQPGELRWFATVDGKEDVECAGPEPFESNGETIEPVSRTFFPARLADNPHLFKTGYGKQLNALPEPLRSQLLYGSFEASMQADPWQVIPTKWVEAAMARWKAREALWAVPVGKCTIPPLGPMTCLGVDVAHGGKDSTVLAPRYGDFIDTLVKYKGSETPDGITAAKYAYSRMEDGCHANVDVIGYGASCHERLRDEPPIGFGVCANAVNFATRSEFTDKSRRLRMVNLRAEAYWRLREELDPDNGSTLCLPPDSALKNELCESHYELTTGGIKIEPKAEIIERLQGRSPDSADAVVLTCLPNGVPYGAIAGSPMPQIHSVSEAQATVQAPPGGAGNRAKPPDITKPQPPRDRKPQGGIPGAIGY